jgi:hypothetical protein
MKGKSKIFKRWSGMLNVDGMRLNMGIKHWRQWENDVPTLSRRVRKIVKSYH